MLVNIVCAIIHVANFFVSSGSIEIRVLHRLPAFYLFLIFSLKVFYSSCTLKYDTRQSGPVVRSIKGHHVARSEREPTSFDLSASTSASIL